ncbi:MAG: cysteine peptidase family C39 domain-containing protein, partial [Candidatus Pacebacteria bacterium]|nr:cysteine peptidase family C39 domain-containing protein [Candidatus Paceibacterota bacterium]
MEPQNFSGLQCLQALFAQFRRSVNFTALITEQVQNDYPAHTVDTLLKLSEDQQLRPERVCGKDAVLSYSGPLLARLNNDAWLLLPDSRHLRTAGNAAILDPSVGAKILTVPLKQFEERFSGEAIIFHNLAQIDMTKHTRLFAFVSIAKHHNSAVDIREIMHEYAIGEEEVRDNLFREIASDYHFKIKRIRLNWDKLCKSASVFPCISIKKNGKYAVFCGFRKTQSGDVEAVVVDPESENCNTPERFLFLPKADFERDYSDSFILLKKIYKLSDEEQPFSLRWFIPEFIKNRGVFGEIALMVVLLTIFSLIVPLFFQIVVDKVLV